MSIPDIDMENFNESFDNWLFDSDGNAAGGLDGDDMASAIVPDTDDSDAEISVDDYDEGAENTWVKDTQRYDKRTVRTNLDVYGQQKNHNWTTTDTEEMSRFFGLCLQMSGGPFDNQRDYWSLKPQYLASNGHSIAGDFMTTDRF
ncbi:hypothetical protein V3C99_000441, partial [Haemonchus contortus]